MAHLNYFPPRIAGVNFCFFIAIPSGGGCWYYAKCEMVLRKIDGKMKMQNCGYSAKLRKWDGCNWCSMADGNGSCHGLTPSFFEEMTRCRRQKHHRRWPGNPNGRSKFRRYRAYLPILRLRDRNWCSAADGSFQRWLKRHVADIKHITGEDQVTLRIDWNSVITKIYAYEIKQDLSNNIFLLPGCCHYDVIAHYFFPTIPYNGFCSQLQKIISRWPWSPPKNREIHIEEFFLVDSIYAKTIDIIK